MERSAFIPKSPPPFRSMQYATLLAAGLQRCQALGGDVWTDYNEHDPGVTILEQLCFAITELGLRAQLPMEDLLARPASHAPADDGLPTGDVILGAAPLTATDYRKLLYDQVKNLKNVWLEPVRDGPGGVYRVSIESHGNEASDDPATVESGRTQLRADVLEQLHAHRNLGEDFDSVEVLVPYPLRVAARVEIGHGASASTVLAQMMFDIQNYLVPFPHVRPALQEEGAALPYDRLFCGPTLELGLIDDDQLQPLRTRISAEEVAGVMGKVDGVVGVSEVTLSVDGVAGTRITVPAGRVPRLDPSIFLRLVHGSQGGDSEAVHGYPIVLARDGAPLPIDPERVFRKLEAMKAGIKQAETVSLERTAADAYRHAPHGIYRDLAAYYSIQHHFPANYGIGRLGAQGNASRSVAQSAAAAQLKAYLLFFEQLLADFGAQIGHAQALFSLADALPRTYAYQELVTPAGKPGEPPDILHYDLFMPASAGLAAPLPHLVYLTDPRRDSAIALRSDVVPGSAAAAHRLDRILACGADKARYTAQALPNGQWHLVLAEEGGAPLAFAARRFGDKAEVEREIAALAEWLARRPEQARAYSRIETRDDYAVRLLSNDGRTLLSASQPSIEQRYACERALLDYGVRSDCYRVQALPDGAYRLELWSEAAPVMLGEERFAGEREALLARAGLARLVASCAAALAHDPAARPRNLQLLPAPSSDADGASAGLAGYREGLAALYRKIDDPTHRRNRFLDHLLARVGERFDDDALSNADPRAFGERDALYDELLRWKLEFLRHYQALGAGRAIARDYRANTPGNKGRSRLEQRLLCLLGILGVSRSLDAAVPPPPACPFKYRRVSGSEARAARAAASPAARGFVFLHDSPNAFQLLFKHGIEPRRYRLAELPDGGVEVRFQWPDRSADNDIAVFRAPDMDAARAAAAGIRHRLGTMLEKADLVYAGEDLLLVEHLLLRPRGADGQPPLPQGVFLDDIDWDGLQWECLPRMAAAIQRDPGAVLGLLSDPTRLAVHALPGGAYRAQVQGKDGQVLARDRLRYPSAVEALTEGARLARHVRTAPRADDFYDCRLSLFFPDWPLRFQTLEFREFAERTVAENCPAHLAASCYWLCAADMQALREAHQDWCGLLAGAASTEHGPATARLRHLVGRLIRESAHG
jgi:hypothetical protein